MNNKHNSLNHFGLLEAEILNVEKRSQKISGWILAFIIIAMNVFISMDAKSDASTFLNITHLLSASLIAWFIGASLLISRGIYHTSFQYLNIGLQIFTVSFYLLVSARLMGDDFAVSSVAPLLYLVVIALTSLSLNPRLSLLAGGFSAVLYVSVYAIWLHDIRYVEGLTFLFGEWIPVILKAIVFIVMGVVAMFIARTSRAMLEKIVTQVSQEENIRFVEDEMTQAAEIQERLIPSSYLNPRCYNIETYYCPAKQVGGDYFDVIEFNNDRCLVVIADVSGKGYAAALMMSNIQAMVTTLANLKYSIEDMVKLINKSIANNSVRGKFVTMVFMDLDPIKNTIKYINCGHNPPMLVSGRDSIIELSEGGPVLGVVMDFDYEAVEQSFLPGDILLAYTDGLSELRDKNNKLLGTQNIMETLYSCEELTPMAVKKILLARILEHSAEVEMADDLSFVCVQAYK